MLTGLPRHVYEKLMKKKLLVTVVLCLPLFAQTVSGEDVAANYSQSQGNGDENIDPDEFLAIPIEAIRDNAGVGFFERLDPARGFAIDSADADENQPFRVIWKVVPNRAYHVWRMADLEDRSSWERLTTAPIVIPSGMDTWVFEDIESNDIDRAFYAVESIDL